MHFFFKCSIGDFVHVQKKNKQIYIVDFDVNEANYSNIYMTYANLEMYTITVNLIRRIYL